MGLREKAKMKLANDLTKQGAKVLHTKSGYKAMTELGVMYWHRSEASSRYGDANLRKDIERLGLTWPFGK